MLFYLIRHAEAGDFQPDEQRALTAHGREQVASLARFLSRSQAFAPAEVWHSPLRRARETAELLVAGVNSAARVREVAGLRPDDNPHEMAALLNRCQHPVALVGHEPNLSALASVLVTGQLLRTVFVMKKGAALALERDGDYWAARWHVSPGLLA